MIGYIRGTVVFQDLKSVIVDVSGVGYKIYTHSSGLDSQNAESHTEGIPIERTFFTYLAVRENALDLYGFERKEELDFFELLLTVSGIGPKSAMGILGVASIDTLFQAISTNDSDYLTKTSGVGKKNAEKIVLELKDKIDTLKPQGHTHFHTESDDALEALKSLGYSEKDSRNALKKAEGETTQEKVRSALRNLR